MFTEQEEKDEIQGEEISLEDLNEIEIEEMEAKASQPKRNSRFAAKPSSGGSSSSDSEKPDRVSFIFHDKSFMKSKYRGRK